MLTFSSPGNLFTNQLIMKTFAFFATLCFTTLFYSKSYAQGEVSILMGVNPSSRIYNGVVGTHTALQYNIDTYQEIHYGVIAQYSRFAAPNGIAVSKPSQVSSFNGFASYSLIKSGPFKPYIKLELGAALNRTRPELESRAGSVPQTSNFFGGQLAPSIGTQISLTRAFTLQLEYKKTVQYGHAYASDGSYNYTGFDMGITYQFAHDQISKKGRYRPSKYRCVYNKKTGATSCFRFR